jgi:hypothetical protein
MRCLPRAHDKTALTGRAIIAAMKHAWSAVATAVLIVSGCDDGAKDDQVDLVVLECTQVDDQIWRTAYTDESGASASRTCSADADCGRWEPFLECGQLDAAEHATAAGCPVPITLSRRSEAERALANEMARLCSQIKPGCDSNPTRNSCKGGLPKCLKGACEMVLVQAF